MQDCQDRILCPAKPHHRQDRSQPQPKDITQRKAQKSATSRCLVTEHPTSDTVVEHFSEVMGMWTCLR